MTILVICVYALNRNKHAELYLPNMFQTSDIELLSPKIEITTYISINHPRVTIFCLLEEHLILPSLYVPKLRYSAHAKK